MKQLIYKLLLVWMLFVSFDSKSQTIHGNVVFTDNGHAYEFTFVKMNENKTVCDTLGYFTLGPVDQLDTLLVFPFPEYIRVKICHIPATENIEFENIPLFRDVEDGIPIINFKTKRASKKYFRNLEKEREHEGVVLKQKIEATAFTWNDRKYPLRLIRENGNSVVLIDLLKSK